MRHLVPIGRFSRVCRLSIKALRHYDELGLLKPVQVDPESGYRYYSLAQADDAATIRLMRSLDMPLEEIRDLLREQREADAVAVRGRQTRHRQRLEERIAAGREALLVLQRLIEGQEADTMSYEVKVKDVPAQPMASIHFRSTVSELGRVLPGAIDEVFAHLRQEGVRPAGAPVVVYHETEGGDGGEQLHMIEVGVPVPEPSAAHAAGRIVVSQIAGGPTAYTLHVGPYDSIPRAFAAIAGWMQERGHQEAGPCREVYLTDPSEVPDPADYRTEVAWPIR